MLPICFEIRYSGVSVNSCAFAQIQGIGFVSGKGESHHGFQRHGPRSMPQVQIERPRRTRTSWSSCSSSVGVYFTIRTKGVQVRYIKDMFTQLTEKKHVPGEQLRLVVPGAHGLHGQPRGHRQHRRRGHGHRHGRPGRGVLDVAHGLWWAPRRRSSRSTLAQIWKVRGTERRVPRRPGLLHRPGAAASAGSACCSAVLLILCFAFGLQRPAGVTTPASALEYYIPDYATNGAADGSGHLCLAVFTAFVIFGGAQRISHHHLHHRAGHGHRLHRCSPLWTTVDQHHAELPAVFSA